MWNNVDRLLGKELETLRGGYRMTFVGYSPKKRVVRLRLKGEEKSQPVPAELFFAALWEGALREV